MAEWQLPVELTLWIAHLSQPLHARLAWRRTTEFLDANLRG